jgi:DUF1680 family protein
MVQAAGYIQKLIPEFPDRYASTADGMRLPHRRRNEPVTSTATTATNNRITPAAPTVTAHETLRPLGLQQVSVTGGFWRERQTANRSVSIPDGYRQLHDAKNLHNFEVAAGRATGDAIGPIFADSDVYKWLEAAAWEYARQPDEQLLAQQLEITELVAAAQEEDGYLNTVVRLREHERYRNPARNHEHYCAGHLFQAAVAQVRCTGHRELLDVAIRFADHLVREFGPGKNRDVDGHPVVEMALVELYRETGTRAYLDLAAYFVEARGHRMLERYEGNSTYLSDRVPVREATTVEGHAVRAVYLAAGAADVATETDDPGLLDALATQFASMTASKQYVTGGLGARWEGEAFGDPYELPSDRAYAETCAAIGAVQWAWRMLLATGDATYADQIERMLYNAFLPGVSLAGGEYFYVNPLQVRHDAHPDDERNPANGRLAWFGCACCPPNVMRTLSSLAGYVASETPRGVQLHQYVPASIRVETAAGPLELEVETQYPWNGDVRIRVVKAPTGAVEVSFRIPAWADGAVLDGQPVAAGGYAVIDRVLNDGESIELSLPMTPRVTRPHPRVDAVRGSVAIERGPLVYALESPDQPAGVVLDDVVIDAASALAGSALTSSFDAQLLGGVTTVKVAGRLSNACDAHTGGSDAAGADAPRADAIELTAIPYLAWANRGPSEMRVWIREA